MGAAYIPLQVQQPQFTTPAQNLQQALTLRQLAGATQIQNQVLQENALKVQDQQRGLDADKALADALLASTTKNDDGTLNIDHDAVGLKLTQAGFGKQAMAYDTQRRADLKVAAEQLKAKLDTQAEAGKQLGGVIDTIPAYPAPPAATATLDSTAPQPDPAAIAAYQTGVKNAIATARQKGLIDDQHAAWALQGAQNPTPEFDQQLRQFGQMGEDHATQMTDARNKINDAVENHLKGTQAANAEAQAAQANAGAQEKQRALDASVLAAAAQQGQATYEQALGRLPYDRAKPFADAGSSDPKEILKVGMQPSQITTAQHEENTAAETARSHKVEESQKGQELTLKKLEIDPYGLLGNATGGPSGNSSQPNAAGAPSASSTGGIGSAVQRAVQQDLHGDDFLKILPAPIAGQVKALAEGRQMLPQGAALKNPAMQQLLGLVQQYDPSADAANLPSRVSVRKAFTSGSESKQINALQTLMGHLDELGDKADSLQNSGFTPGNTLKNWIAQKTGDPAVNNFNTVLHKVVDEDVRAYRGSGGSEADIQQRLSDFSSSNSPTQLHGAIAETAKLVKSKIDALNTQYQQGMGTTAKPLAILTPKTQSIADKLVNKAQNAAATGPAKLPTVTSKAQHDALPKGASYIGSDGNTYVKGQ